VILETELPELKKQLVEEEESEEASEDGKRRESDERNFDKLFESD
jgi:hypothetical protein